MHVILFVQENKYVNGSLAQQHHHTQWHHTTHTAEPLVIRVVGRSGCTGLCVSLSVIMTDSRRANYLVTYADSERTCYFWQGDKPNSTREPCFLRLCCFLPNCTFNHTVTWHASQSLSLSLSLCLIAQKLSKDIRGERGRAEYSWPHRWICGFILYVYMSRSNAGECWRYQSQGSTSNSRQLNIFFLADKTANMDKCFGMQAEYSLTNF